MCPVVKCELPNVCSVPPAKNVCLLDNVNNLMCTLFPAALQLEVTVGRIAMLGFTGLILNEAFFQKAFFPHLF